MSFSSNPNPSYNTIKGLTILISDIRNCTTRMDEAKRVEQELDKIRKKFGSTKGISGYDKKKYVWKLLYIYILGYKIDFGHNYMADLITSIKFSEKLTGYISMSVLFKEDTKEIDQMVNSIRNDLNNQNSLCQAMALTLVANLNNKDLIESVSQDVLQFLVHANEKQPHTLKKAMACLTRIIKVKREIHSAGTWCKYILKMIDIKNFEILLSVCSLVLNIFQQFGNQGYEEVAMKLFNSILYQMKHCPQEYIYYHIKAPWVQIKILKIMQTFNPTVFNSETVSHIKEYVDYIYKKTQSILLSDSKYARYYAEYCIFFEVVNLIDYLNVKIGHRVFENFIQLLGHFLQEDHRKFPNKDINTKYLALDSMAKLCKYTTGNNILNNHMKIIFGSLRDNDISIRRRALDLTFLICSGESSKLICKELLTYFQEDEPQLKEDVALKIAILAEKYASDLGWYIDTILKMLEVAGDYVSEDVTFRFIQIIIGFSDQEPNTQLQLYAADKVFKFLEKDYVYDNAIKLAAFVLGEFGHFLAQSDPSKSIERQIELLQKHIPLASSTSSSFIMNALAKFTEKNSEVRNLVIPTFESYLESWDTELQQRAIEYIILSKNDGEDENLPNLTDIRHQIFAKMPEYPIELKDNSLLMRRLAKVQQNLVGKGVQDKSSSSQPKSGGDDEVIETVSNPVIQSSLKENEVENLLLNQSTLDSRNLYTNHVLYIKNPSGFSPQPNKFADAAILINKDLLVHNYDNFKSQLTNPSSNGGIIFSDENFKIEIKVFPMNKGALPVLMNFLNNPENIKVALLKTYENVNPMISTVRYNKDQPPQVLMKISLNDSFSNPFVLGVSANVGSISVKCTFALPILITKFLEPYDISFENYNTLLLEYTNATSDEYHRFDAILYNPIDGKGQIVDFLKKLGSLLHALNFKVYPPQDSSNFHEIDSISVLNANDSTRIPVLLQASFVPSFSPEWRLSIRAKAPDTVRFGTLATDIYSIIKFYVNPY